MQGTAFRDQLDLPHQVSRRNMLWGRDQQNPALHRLHRTESDAVA
jgi:hypothetical protein